MPGRDNCKRSIALRILLSAPLAALFALAAPLPLLASEITPSGVWQIRAGQAIAQYGVNGSGVRVGVVDGLIDRNHVDLKVVGVLKTGGRSYSASGDSHGTHVAGTIATLANGIGVVGVAPGARLVSAAAFDRFDNWTGKTTVNWFSRLYNKRGTQIVNTSFGPGRAGVLADWDELRAWNRFRNKMLVTKAAGNDGTTLKMEYCDHDPIICEKAAIRLKSLLIVGALNFSATDIAHFSNRPGENCFGVRGQNCKEKSKFKYFFVVAPGTSIHSTLPGGSYGYMSGTSMAAPHVAGLAALVMSRWPHLKNDPAAVVRIIKQTAVDMGAPGVDAVFGWGRVDAVAALSPVGQTRIPTGTTVSGSFVSADSSMLMWSPTLFASALGQMSKPHMIFLDKFGRDYGVPLSYFTYDSRNGDALSSMLAYKGKDAAPIVVGENGLLFVSSSVDPVSGETAPAAAFVVDDGATTRSFAANFEPAAYFNVTGMRPAPSRRLHMASHGPSMHLDLVGKGVAAGQGTRVSGLDVSAAVFLSGDRADAGDGRSRRAAGAEMSIGGHAHETVYLGLQLGAVVEEASALGTAGNGFFQTPPTAASYAGLSGVWSLPGNASVGGLYEIGLARSVEDGAFAFGRSKPLVTEAAALWVTFDDLGIADENDRVRFQVSQPLRVMSGNADLTLPVGRTPAGAVRQQAFAIPLAPDAREIRFDVDYETPLPRNLGDLSLGFAHSMNARHVAGAGETLAMARFDFRF